MYTVTDQWCITNAKSAINYSARNGGHAQPKGRGVNEDLTAKVLTNYQHFTKCLLSQLFEKGFGAMNHKLQIRALLWEPADNLVIVCATYAVLDTV